jgi:chemotaxis protein histidine kinase CheA
VSVEETFDSTEYRALRALFRDESHEALDRVAQLLLRAGTDHIDPETLAELLRTTHSLKGTAGTVGLRAFSDTAHRLEGVLERLRSGTVPWSTATRDALVEVVDWLRASTESDPDGDEPAPPPAPPVPRAPTPPPPPPPPDLSSSSSGVPQARMATEPTLPFERRGRRDEPAQLRVDPSRIDRLMDSVGELVFDRTRIERRVAELRLAIEQLVLLAAALGVSADADLSRELEARLAQLSDVTSALSDDAAALRRTGHALQDGLTDIRMQSARLLFQRLAPQVRALARAAGKPIHLVTLGGETEFDKSVADQIVEPLIHLLRNALAHGIESLDVRRAAGKPDEGQITLLARHEGQSVIIEVTDDGAGIDRARMRHRLVASGTWTEARAAAADDDDLLRALFAARISSREEVDELAGRGIGLDAVRETVVRLGGDLSATSEQARGTTFTVRLPLTTAISNALLFKVGGHVFAIPNVHVLETTRVEASSPALPSHLRVRDAAVPLVRLHDVLGAPLPPDARHIPAVVIDYASRRLALTCDKIIGPREIVVKSIGPLLGPLPLYAGGTISGSGKVQLILDPAALVRLAYPEAAAVTSPVSPPGRLLVADDSHAVREAMLLLLERAGYQVDVAENGLVAWRMLGRNRYDALLTDLEMPEMTGLELIERVRADALLSTLPVIVISSRASDSFRARAADLAVRAVLPKPVSESTLLGALAPR